MFSSQSHWKTIEEHPSGVAFFCQDRRLFESKANQVVDQISRSMTEKFCYAGCGKIMRLVYLAVFWFLVTCVQILGQTN